MSKFKANAKTEWNGPAVIKDFDKMNFKSLTESAIIVESDAKALAPVDKGFLRNSISRAVTKISAVVGASAFYAIFVELGTRFQSAQAFLFPALTGNIRKIIGIFKKNGQNIKWVVK